MYMIVRAQDGGILDRVQALAALYIVGRVGSGDMQASDGGQKQQQDDNDNDTDHGDDDGSDGGKDAIESPASFPFAGLIVEVTMASGKKAAPHPQV